MENSLWVERYRPNTLENYVGNESIKSTMSSYIKQNDIQNLIFYGPAGTGKTTLAKIIVKSIDCDYLYINASDERGIDTIRDKVSGFASTASFKSLKVVILDEADYLNANSTQPALRNFMEEYSKNCGFILTCNFKNRIISPLHSRCSVIDFDIKSAEKPKLASEFFERLKKILEMEGIEYEDKVVAAFIQKHFPDWRRILNEIQRYSAVGKIDTGILSNLQEVSIKELMNNMKAKNYTSVRKWVAENINNDTNTIFRKLYDKAGDVFKAQSIPQLCLILAD